MSRKTIVRMNHKWTSSSKTEEDGGKGQGFSSQWINDAEGDGYTNQVSECHRLKKILKGPVRTMTKKKATEARAIV